MKAKDLSPSSTLLEYNYTFTGEVIYNLRGFPEPLKPILLKNRPQEGHLERNRSGLQVQAFVGQGRIYRIELEHNFPRSLLSIFYICLCIKVLHSPCNLFAGLNSEMDCFRHCHIFNHLALLIFLNIVVFLQELSRRHHYLWPQEGRADPNTECECFLQPCDSEPVLPCPHHPNTPSHTHSHNLPVSYCEWDQLFPARQSRWELLFNL